MSRSLSQWLQELRSRTTRTLSRRRKTRGHVRPRLGVEELESRLTPTALSVGPFDVAKAAVSFDATSGALTLRGGAEGSSAQVAILGNGDVALTLNGQAYTSDPAARSFDAALGGASEATLQQLSLTGGPADSLTLKNVTTDAGLTIFSDGGVTLAGTIDATGRLTVTAGTVDVQGAVHGSALALTTTGLLSVEAGGSLVARAGGNGGSITLAAESFVNDGQVDAGGAQGGRVAVTAKDYFNAGLISATGITGSAGQVQIDFTDSYIDTATATTTASSVRSTGSQVIVNGGSSGRLFSSGRFDATGTSGGSIDLLGHDVLLVAAVVDASGTSAAGRVLIGGDYQGDNPTIPNAQTVDITSTTTVRADGGGSAVGGRVVVWSETNTVFQGNVLAQGGGAGGFIEVSSHGQLTDVGTADAGKGGTLLLDPKYLVIQEGTGGTFPQFNLVNPGSGGAFGTTILTLANGNIVVTDPKVNSSKGAVYLFDGRTGALLSTLSGSTSNDQIGSGGVTALSNGNFVISSPAWSSSKGAATWGNGATGASGVVSSANSLVGSTSGDEVSSGGVIVLTNGAYVVRSPLWNSLKGAATWGSGTAGVSGVLSSAKSLVGTTAGAFGSGGDQVSSAGVVALTNGNYVVRSPAWNGSEGAATWGSGTGGIAGTISASNSLVGSSSNDRVGSGKVAALPNGNYVVASPFWNNSQGAATWGTGASGVIGVLSSANSLVGNTGGGNSGDQVGSGGVTVLTNGNYVVSSPAWNDRRGAATWGSGATGVSGVLSATNSLLGSEADFNGHDTVSSGGVTALTNGNYVVSSPNWSATLGAATWGNGTTGTTGTVAASNSLVGSSIRGFVGDRVSIGGVTALTNGNYIVSSPFWYNPPSGFGAATWGNGTTGITGTISASNSLVSPGSDDVSSGGITALTNGNYVVCSPGWNGAIGAATWGNGTTGITGTVSASNSFVGSSGQQVGSGGATALPNGDYVVKSPTWNNNQGAATWVDGSAAATGTVSATNSLVGSSGGTSGDQVSSAGVVVLPNGNYVVLSPLWNNSRGAATWGNATMGVSGTLSSSNSLVGTTGGNTGDQVGSAGVTVLADGNFVVSSPKWNGAEGAVTWMDGTTGTTLDGQNTFDAGNSLLGASASAGLGRVQLGAINGSFVAAFSTEGSGRVTVGFVPSGGSGGGQLSYGFDPTQTITEPPDVIAETLAAGTNVVLQANDDITINSPITVIPTGTPGNLTLQVGRSILLNAGITTAGGNLTLIANDTKADGVVDSQRDPGNAVITMISGVILNTGTGALSVDLKTSTDKTNNGKGVVTLLGLTASLTTLSSSSTFGITIDGQTPGDGVTVGTYT
ncbi:MAG TPA: hypothetical protein VGY66_18930, partial [Gemmataceae bacterium]|nr:hypothetical protein [Gemmataceae bacterium]